LQILIYLVTKSLRFSIDAASCSTTSPVKKCIFFESLMHIHVPTQRSFPKQPLICDGVSFMQEEELMAQMEESERAEYERRKKEEEEERRIREEERRKREEEEAKIAMEQARIQALIRAKYVQTVIFLFLVFVPVMSSPTILNLSFPFARKAVIHDVNHEFSDFNYP